MGKKNQKKDYCSWCEVILNSSFSVHKSSDFGRKPRLLVYRVAFALRGQSWRVVTSTMQPAKPEIFAGWPFKKFVMSCPRKSHVSGGWGWWGGSHHWGADIYLTLGFCTAPTPQLCLVASVRLGPVGSRGVRALRPTGGWEWPCPSPSTLQGSSPFLPWRAEYWQPGLGASGGRLQDFSLEKLTKRCDLDADHGSWVPTRSSKGRSRWTRPAHTQSPRGLRVDRQDVWGKPHL